MEMHNRNQSDLLPYEKLAILGIDREKTDSLPMEVKEKLMAGEVTPIMQVSINARNGRFLISRVLSPCLMVMWERCVATELTEIFLIRRI